MKVLGAGIFLGIYMFLLIVLVKHFFGEHSFWVVVFIPIPSLVLLYAVFYLFYACRERFKYWWRSFTSPTVEETVGELEARGLVETQRFGAKRAFQVEEYEDEGLHYFLELEDGNVLYLRGQYLHDYEEIDDAPEYSQPKTFPCQTFTIKRHKKYGYVLAIETQGEVMEPEIVLPAFSRYYVRKQELPQDGDIICDRSFDEIKAELQNAK